MADKTPVRVTYDGSNNAVGLAEFQTGETVGIEHGGTGQTTAQAAIDALLPDQSSSNGYFLTTDGTNSSWAEVNTSLTISDGSVTDTFTTGNTLTFTGGTGVTTAVGDDAITFSIGQAVGTSDNVTFANLTLSGNLTVNGTTTSIATETITLADNTILLNSNATGSASEDAGIEIERGDDTNKTFIWDESEDKWSIGSETFVAGTVEANLTGDVTGNVTGNVTGDVTGDLTGNVTGNVTGDVTGDLTGNVTGNVTGDVTGDLTGNVTGNVTGNADTATAWATARDLSLTGDGTATLSSVDGTANVSGSLTLATVNSNTGQFGSTTAVPVFTVNGKGLITAVETASISTSFTLAADNGSNDTFNNGETLTLAGGPGITTTVSDNTITITAAASGGYFNSTTETFPGASGNSDYGSGETYVGESETTDSFGVSTITTFSLMDPLGSIPDAVDLGALS